MGHDWDLRQKTCFLAAGVPLSAPVAGIAMGLILEPDGSYVVLSDILGAEDALGDMDFKVRAAPAIPLLMWHACREDWSVLVRVVVHKHRPQCLGARPHSMRSCLEVSKLET